MNKILFIIFSIAFIACKENKPPQKEEKILPATMVQLTPEQLKNAGIETQPAENRNMHATIKVSGVVDVPPQNIVSISFPLGGYLKHLQLLPGMKVSKGQVLATVEDQQIIQLQQEYLIAKSRLHFLEADFARQQELNAAKANSDKVFQQVKSEFESQQVLLSSLAAKLKLINIQPEKLHAGNIASSIQIHSPLSGYVTKVNVNNGKYVSPTDILFELIDPADIHLSLTVFEKDVISLSPGQTVISYANNNREEKHPAKIHLITSSINEDHASEVHCHFDKYDKRLIPGMFMNAEIELDNANVPAVPAEAIVKWENKDYLFVAQGKDTFIMTPVETGNTSGEYIVIKTALEGKQIVTKNAYTLLMKMKNGSEE